LDVEERKLPWNFMKYFLFEKIYELMAMARTVPDQQHIVDLP